MARQASSMKMHIEQVIYKQGRWKIQSQEKEQQQKKTMFYFCMKGFLQPLFYSNEKDSNFYFLDIWNTTFILILNGKEWEWQLTTKLPPLNTVMWL